MILKLMVHRNFSFFCSFLPLWCVRAPSASSSIWYIGGIYKTMGRTTTACDHDNNINVCDRAYEFTVNHHFAFKHDSFFLFATQLYGYSIAFHFILFPLPFLWSGRHHAGHELLMSHDHGMANTQRNTQMITAVAEWTQEGSSLVEADTFAI